MSASREKKDRQDVFSSGLSEKERKNQKEATEKKRKKTIYTVVGIVCVILVAALLIWDSGIFQRGRTVLTVSDTNYTAADVQYYYAQAYNQEYYYSYNYGGYGLTNFDYTQSPEDQTYSTDEETGAVTTYQDYFLNTAVDNLTQVTAIVNAANEAGYTLSQDGKDSVAEQIESMKSSAASGGYTYGGYLTVIYGEYMTTSAYENCLTRAQLASEYYNTYSDSLTYDDAALQSYYDENADTLDTYNYSYLSFRASVETQTDEDGNEIEMTEEEQTAALEEAKTTAKANAEAVLAALQAGGDINDLITEYSPYSSAVESASVGSSLSSAYGDWLKDSSRTAGDSDIVEYDADTSYVYYVVVFNGRELDETPTVDIRHILIKADLTEDDESTPDVDESSDTPTQEQYDAAYDTASGILEDWEGGEKTAESFGALAEEYSEDTGSNTNGGLYENVYEGQMFDAFNDWIMDSSRQPGDTTLIQNTQTDQYGWHVVYFQSWENPVWMNTAESALRSDDLTDWLDGLTGTLTVTRTDYFASMVG